MWPRGGASRASSFVGRMISFEDRHRLRSTAPRDDRLASGRRPDTLAPMKVIVCGSYDLPTPAFVWRELDRLHVELGITALMQGGAAGVDRFARDWAAEHPEVECFICPAQWHRYGSAAALKRNARMLEWRPDLVIAFPGRVGDRRPDQTGDSGRRRGAARPGARAARQRR
jgi:YspA, cpYpsA-related SLOG family